MQTTLSEIRKYRPCEAGWGKLLRALGKTRADDDPLSIIAILDSNGLEDALWCLRAVQGRDREIRLYAVWCARQTEDLITDRRSKDALDVAARHAHSLATDEELAAASAAARVAASASAGAATRSAAWAARWAAAWAAASATARGAAGAAMDAAAWAAVPAAARAAQEKELRLICAHFPLKSQD